MNQRMILITGFLTAATVCGLLYAQQGERRRPNIQSAVCVLVPVGDSGVSGVVHFHRAGRGQVKVTGEVSGLAPGKHGFHVHEFGDISNPGDGKCAGGHFNPEKTMHGAPDADERHVGDLGNIEANADGVATIDMTDSVIRLIGPHGIVGRSIVIHADPDDFGQPTGNAGARVAFGVIGIGMPMEE